MGCNSKMSCSQFYAVFYTFTAQKASAFVSPNRDMLFPLGPSLSGRNIMVLDTFHHNPWQFTC